MSEAPYSVSDQAMARCLRGRCPHCGEGRLFRSWLQFRDACEVCGLALNRHDVGDGAAYIAICLIGTAVTVGAAALEILVQPPYWMHAVLWLPLTLLGSLVVLHYAKAMLLASAYTHHRMGGAE